MFFGDGGSIPLINWLEDRYPKASFLVCGVAGPNSNAHGPNENLNIDYTKKFVCSIA